MVFNAKHNQINEMSGQLDKQKESPLKKAKPDEVIIDTEQELQKRWNAEKKNYHRSMSDEEADDASKKKKPKDEIENRFKLIDIKFPSTIVKSSGVFRLRWDLWIIVLVVF